MALHLSILFGVWAKWLSSELPEQNTHIEIQMERGRGGGGGGGGGRESIDNLGGGCISKVLTRWAQQR